MAGNGNEEVEEVETTQEYESESDPEEAKMSLKMRRRTASDDEEEEEEEQEERERSGGEEGEDDVSEDGAADYYDEEEEEEDEEEEEYYEEEEERERSADGGEREGKVGEGEERERSGGEGEGEAGEGEGEGEGGEGGEKKENEPSAVPTSGAFYMHDDRFRDNAAGARNRRTFGGRKLWESKDERKWGHDKFEEMNTRDRPYDEGRRSAQGYRGRGKARGSGRGYARGNRPRGYDGNNIQNTPPKVVRGRGPRRYQPSMKNKSDMPPSQYKQSAKSLDRTSHTGSGRVTPSTSNYNAEQEYVPAKKVASNLNYASPPFYPSGSSNTDTPLTQKKEVQAGNYSRNTRSAAVENSYSVPLGNPSVRGKNVIDSIGMDKLHIDSRKPVNNMHAPSAASSSLGAAQMPQSRAQGRGVAVSVSPMLQPSQTNNQYNKVNPPTIQAPQRNPVQNRGQPSFQPSGQQLGQRPVGIAASPGDLPLKTGKGTAQASGRGSLVYNGAQVIGSGGSIGAGHGDQNIPLFPVMQFGGQHPGGIPTVGVAIPGYVSQPNGMGNSEMTWFLASAPGAMGAAGALGPAGALSASYCPPYITVDGSYHARPGGQTSALPATSKENNLIKANNEPKPPQRSEGPNDEFSQRQNKPRRYSEMNFSQ